MNDSTNSYSDKILQIKEKIDSDSKKLAEALWLFNKVRDSLAHGQYTIDLKNDCILINNDHSNDKNNSYKLVCSISIKLLNSISFYIEEIKETKDKKDLSIAYRDYIKKISTNYDIDTEKLFDNKFIIDNKYYNNKFKIDNNKYYDNTYNINNEYLNKNEGIQSKPNQLYTSTEEKDDNIIKTHLNKLTIEELNSLEKVQVQLKKYSCFSLEDAEINADEFRKDNQLSLKQPIFDLMNTLENLGIVIIEIDNINNKFNDFDGASEIIDGIPFIILLNNISDGARQRFTIAHELGHMVLDIKENQMNEEKACDRFASSLLMPSLAVINEFGKSRSSLNFYELNAFKNEYKVSYSSIIYRLKDLNIISEYLYKKWMIIINKTIGKERTD